MKSDNIFLLDCTLRDGGYVNDWKWGHSCAKSIINKLTMANVDVVEVGFLRNVDGYDPDVTVCNTIEELNKLLPEKKQHTMYSAMAMRSNYDIDKLSPYCGNGIEMIRITAHDYDIKEGLEFAQLVKEKGYKLSINPINIMGYSDQELLWILNRVNQIMPFQFSIVDTFGSMKRRDLDRIASIVDNNLDKSIRVALHLHENMSMSYALAQNYIDKHFNRAIAIDGSLMGMGRIPGNLPIELIADYLNDYTDSSYDLDFMMDAIQDYILKYKGRSYWGYTPAYFLSARFNLHRNYAEHYLKKGDLTNRDINHILSRFDNSKKTAFDAKYADEMYYAYQDNRIDDSCARKALKEKLANKNILILAPGSTLSDKYDIIADYISKNSPIIISTNFVPDKFNIDYAFFSNRKRFCENNIKSKGLIVTSNIIECHSAYQIDYNSLTGAFSQGCNSLIMLLKLLKEMSVELISIAGADGFVSGGVNYFDPKFASNVVHEKSFNSAVASAIKLLDVNVTFITPSAYDI